MDSSRVAVLMLVHQDPIQFHRSVDALAPFPVVVHCDVATPVGEYEAMQRALRPDVSFIERSRTPWGAWSAVEAELDCLEAAVRSTSAQHFVMVSGSDYPLASTEVISDALARYEGRSLVAMFPMPFANWGPDGGFQRLHYRYVVIGERPTRLPYRRKLPDGLRYAGASVSKILCREHAEALLEVRRSRPDLVRFWRPSRSADETFIATMLASFVITDPGDVVVASPWYLDWQGVGNNSPKWLDDSDWEAIVERGHDDTVGAPLLFARKFSTTKSAGLLDRIDRELRAGNGS